MNLRTRPHLGPLDFVRSSMGVFIVGVLLYSSDVSFKIYVQIKSYFLESYFLTDLHFGICQS